MFNDEIRLTLKLLFTIYFLKTFFSMSYEHMTMYSNLALAYCIAMIDERKICKNKQI